MPDTRRVPALLVGVCILLASACAGIPDRGSIHVGRPLPGTGGLGDVDVHVLPPAPLPNMSPSDIVRGFLRAMVNDDGNFEIARAYLTRHAAASWRTTNVVTTYDDSAVSLVTGTTPGTVRLQAPRTGSIDERGDFTPRSGAIRSTFHLTRENGEWRIDRLHDGVLLSTYDAQRVFRLADVYYLGADGGLVPEPVLLRPQARGVTTALVRALLSGPGQWLAPVVRTAFPPRTDLLGNVPVDPTGTAEVNLSGPVRQVSPGALRLLSAQLVWTLRQVGEISGVRLLADGAPLAIPHQPGVISRDAFPSFAPGAAAVIRSGFFRSSQGWHTTRDRIGGLPQFARLNDLALTSDGRRAAGLSRGHAGVVLHSGDVGAALPSRLRATTLTAPSFDPEGDVFTVATQGVRRWVAEVTTAGKSRSVPTQPGVLEEPVQQLELSPDGARVAIVAGPHDVGRLLVGRLGETRTGARIDGFRQLLPSNVPAPRVSKVLSVAWPSSDQLIATVELVTGVREVLAVDVDGYSTRTISLAGVSGAPSQVAASPGEPLLLAAGGSVWRDDATAGWLRVGRGSEPAYAN